MLNTAHCTVGKNCPKIFWMCSKLIHSERTFSRVVRSGPTILKTHFQSILCIGCEVLVIFDWYFSRLLKSHSFARIDKTILYFLAENYPHRFFASLRWVGCEWRGLGGGLFWQFLCFFLGYSAPLLRKQIFPIPLIKYFPLLLCLSNIFLPFLLWDQMFTCPKIFLQNFPSSPKYHFPKFPGSPPLSKRAKSVFKNLFADLSWTICPCYTTFLSLLPCERRSQGSAIWWEVAINCRWPKHWWESL